MSNMDFALRSLRALSGLSQQDVANALGIGQTTVSMWETAVSCPKAAMLPEIAQLYGCSVADLYNSRWRTEHGKSRAVPADAKRSSGAVQDQYKTVGQADSQ